MPALDEVAGEKEGDMGAGTGHHGEDKGGRRASYLIHGCGCLRIAMDGRRWRGREDPRARICPVCARRVSRGVPAGSGVECGRTRMGSSIAVGAHRRSCLTSVMIV